MANCFLEDTVKEQTPSKSALGTVYIYFKYCNLRCHHCWIDPPYSDEVTVRNDEAPLANMISGLEECRSLGMRAVKLTGGEPFTRKDMFELLEYLKKNNIKITMETNGTLIREPEARALKEAGASHVGVSLDGPDERIHSLLRGVAGSFEAAVEGIKALKKEGLNTQVIISLWKGNKAYIKSTIVMVKALGVNSVKINPINCIERGGRMRKSGEVLSVGETIEFYRELSAELEKDAVDNVIFDIPPAFRPVKNMRFDKVSTCGIFNILGILGDGSISICGIGSSLETLVLGHITKDRIADIWRDHPVLKQIREDVPAKLEGVCGQCMMKKYCLGKCRAEAYYTQGSLLAPLSFCQTAYDEGLFPESRLVGIPEPAFG
jgi:SynChlorMet cassette radical SAM/SPASM protein ScmF